MRYTLPRFLKGISKSFDILFSQDPERLYTLQNARLIKRGEMGFVSRIEGFVQLFSPQKYNNLDVLPVEGTVDATNYTKGYRLFFNDDLFINEELPILDAPGIVDFVKLNEEFLKNIRFTENKIRVFTDTVNTKENVVKRKIPILKFVSTVTVTSTIRIPNRTILEFTDTVEVFDEKFEKDEVRKFFRAILDDS